MGKQVLQIWILKGMMSSLSAIRGSDGVAQLGLETGRKVIWVRRALKYK